MIFNSKQVQIFSGISSWRDAWCAGGNFGAGSKATAETSHWQKVYQFIDAQWCDTGFSLIRVLMLATSHHQFQPKHWHPKIICWSNRVSAPLFTQVYAHVHVPSRWHTYIRRRFGSVQTECTWMYATCSLLFEEGGACGRFSSLLS